MRIKLNFIGSDFDELGFGNKVIFPVNLNEVNKIKDLKIKISQFLTKRVESKDIHVEELFIDNFLLPEEFEVNLMLNNDDEVK
jgi:hypothetical protein